MIDIRVSEVHEANAYNASIAFIALRRFPKDEKESTVVFERVPLDVMKLIARMVFDTKAEAVWNF